MTKTKKLTLSAILTALAFVLVMVSKVLPAPWAEGGNITIASMVPIIMVSVILGTKWGLFSGFVFSLIQMLTGFYVPPATTIWSFLGVVLLDYVFAFSCLGLASFFVKIMGNKGWAIPLSGTIVTGIRYALHVLSGLLIWGAFADTDCVLIYALLYNGSYMIPEMIITTVVLALLAPKLKEKYEL
ncbi:MAG: energy-coupled thiamine transporter ThiT [Clostridia bacterium]|nr:energy-coupled thiamine transporter ThiT [Clostridia bacterium]